MKRTSGLRNKWLVAALTLLTVTASACGSKPAADGNAAATSPAAAAAPKPIALSFTVGLQNMADGAERKKVWQSIVDAYVSKHPNVKIDLDTISEQDAGAWRTKLTTGLVGGTSPDIIISKYTWSFDDLNKGLIADLTSYYDKPTPYNDNKKWRDTFAPAILSQMADPVSGKIAGVSLETVSVRAYYNIDLFQKLGLQIPKTWDQFMDIQKKIKDSGVIPFAFGSGSPSPHLQWVATMMENQLMADKLKPFDYDHNNILSLNEIVGAVDQGGIDLQKPEWNAVFPLLKSWLDQYGPKGINSINSDAAIKMFLRGDAAMVLAGNFDLKQIQESTARKFNFGTFQFPILPKSMFPESNEKNYELGGYPDSVYTIPKTVTGDKLDASVDFLMYLSSPEVATTLGNQLYMAPTLTGVKLPPNLDGFQITGDLLNNNLFGAATSKKINQDFNQIGQLYLEGSITLDKYMTELQKTVSAEAANLMKANGWSKDNQYGSKK